MDHFTPLVEQKPALTVTEGWADGITEGLRGIGDGAWWGSAGIILGVALATLAAVALRR